MEPHGQFIRIRSLAAEVFIGAVVVAVLYLARQVLVPIALAIILSFILGLPVQRLRRAGVAHLASVFIVVFVFFALTLGAAGLVGGQLVQLAGDLPRYETTIHQKVRSLQSMIGKSGVLESVGNFIGSLTSDDDAPQAAADAPNSKETPKPPVAVVVHQPRPNPLEVLRRFGGPLLEPIGTAGIVIVFVLFILLQQQDLRDRLIWLMGSGDMRRSSEAINVAAKRLSRFFLMQTAINVAFGIVIGAGLWLIGVPNPLLWGFLATVLRFVPYIGSIMAALLPLALSAAVDPGWTKTLWTAALFLTLEPILGQVIEPWLYGRSTGLSPIAVATAATFWTWLWGPIGLVLATPLTMLLVVVGQHVDRLAFLAVIFGDAPALSADQSFFHRIMSENADEAAERAQSFIKENSLVAFYDEVALPGLRMAQIEATKGTLEPDKLREMAAEVEQVVENLQEAEPNAASAAATALIVEQAGDRVGDRGAKLGNVLCIAGRSPLDEAAAAMLRQLLEKRGIGVQIASYGAASPAQLPNLEIAEADLICMSYLAIDTSPTHTKFLIRRLRKRARDIPILAGFWTFTDEKCSLEQLRQESGADFIATSMQQAVEVCINKIATRAQHSDVSEARASGP